MELSDSAVAPGDQSGGATLASSRDRWILFAVLAVIAGYAGLTWSARAPDILTNQDDAEYVLLARALAEGSYREIWRIDLPTHSQYPPGYPALLAVWQGVFGHSQDVRLALSLALGSALLLLLFAALARRFERVVAAASVCVLAVNPYLVAQGGDVASEIPYAFATVACLYALIRSEDARSLGTEGASSRWLLAAAVIAILAALTRTVGIALLAAVWIWMLLARRWRAALWFGLASAATSGGWLLWTVMAPEQFSGRSYVADVQDSLGGSPIVAMLERILHNGRLYATENLSYAVAFPHVEGTVVDNVVYVLVLAATLGAAFFAFARRWRAAFLYVAVYGSLLLGFRWEHTRFLVPVLVLIVPGVLIGAVAITDRFRPSWSRAVLVGLTLMLVFGGAIRSRKLLLERSCDRSGDLPAAECTDQKGVGYLDAIRFIRDDMPEDTTLLTVKSGALFYYTGRRSITVEGAREQHPDDFVEFVRSQGADYILLTSVDGTEVRHYAPLLQANCEVLRLVKAFSPGSLLFEVSAKASPMRTVGDACAALAAYRDLNAGPTDSASLASHPLDASSTGSTMRRADQGE